jgi:sphinganine C4-monooxygenase
MQTSIIPWISEKYLLVILPVAAYWMFSLLFYICDERGYLSKYRLHTPAEFLKRNRVSMREVIRDVVIQHVIQMAVGIALAMFEPDSAMDCEEYGIQRWTQRIRRSQAAIPWLLLTLGVDSKGLVHHIQASAPTWPGLLASGRNPANMKISAVYASWEVVLAKTIHWILLPAIQYLIAMLAVDTWQYWIHRTVHYNSWLYRR